MLGIDERTLRAVWTVFLFAVALAIVFFVRETLVVFALAIFFAYVIWPIVGLVERFMPRRRNLALAVVYSVLVGGMVLIGIQVVPEIASEASNLSTNLPKLISGERLWQIPLPGFLKPYQGQLVTAINSHVGSLQAHILPMVQQAGTHILAGLSTLLFVILIPILAFFFLKDAESIRVSLIGAVEPGRDRGLMAKILDDIHVVLQKYIRALVLMSAAAFVVWMIFLSSMQYSYELLMAGVAASGEFIPVIGPAAALGIMVLVCLATGAKGLFWLVIFWGVYRMFADYVLNPFLMSAGVEMPPLLILFGVLAGGDLAGVPGMFFSIPVIAILRVIVTDLRCEYIQKRISHGVHVDLKMATPNDLPGGLLVNEQPAKTD